MRGIYDSFNHNVGAGADGGIDIVIVVHVFRNHPPITQDELVRNAQEIFDAVASGDQEPWKKYFADDSMYFDEKGRSMDKAALVKDVTPLPPGYSGAIKVVNPKSNIQGDTADPFLRPK